MRSAIDATKGGTLINKMETEAYDSIEEMMLNNYQQFHKKTLFKKAALHDVISTLSFHDFVCLH